MESRLGQIIARNGVLAIILVWALWQNGKLEERLLNLEERLFSVIENNTRALIEVRQTIERAGLYGRN